MTTSAFGRLGCAHADHLAISHRDREPSGTAVDSNLVKWRLKRHKDDIKRWLNVAELLPHLRQRGLIKSGKIGRRLLRWYTLEKRSRIFTYISKALELDSTVGVDVDAYLRFMQCLRDEGEHLGHHHIANLLETGVSECDADDLAMSRLVEQALPRVGTQVKDCLSVKDLLPYLRQSKLLTASELELLHEDSSMENSVKIQRLLSILDTKGPIAHLLFFQCLEQEKTHSGHTDIYKDLCHEIDTILEDASAPMDQSADDSEDEMPEEVIIVCEPYVKTPCRLGLEGSLAGHEHIGEMRALQQHRYHGRWDCFRQGIDGLTQSEDINVTAVGKLHHAVASIMSGNTNISLCLVDEVEKMCSTLYGNNNQIMLGRCLYIRSAVYRHRQDYDSARRYLDLSKQKLANSEPGADTASLYYHEGTLQLDLLQQQSSGSRSRRQREKAEKSFSMAIEHAEHGKSGLPLIAWHSKVFLSLLYLGSSHDSVSQELPSLTDLNRAESILKTLDYKQLPPRTLALYHIAYSDIYRWKSDLALARLNANLGLSKAEQGHFAFEKRFALHRLQSLH